MGEAVDELVRSHVEHCMGTVFSFDLRDPVPATVLTEVVAELHRLDRMFSTYRSDSEISRVRRGDLRLADCSPEVAEVLAIGRAVERRSGGAFSLYASGALDPSAVVKGWAVERAAAALSRGGAGRLAVGGGGDVRVHGSPTDRPWRIGIADPHRRGTTLLTLRVVDAAVATSGTAERGAHLIEPSTGRPATGWASLTLVGPELATVDALSTAAFVLGEAAREWVEDLGPGYGAFGVRPDGSTWRSSGLRAWTDVA